MTGEPVAAEPVVGQRVTGERTVVAIDGPAGSGKSSVSRESAKILGFDYQDSGAAYRALAWFALEAGLDVSDPKALVGALEGFDYQKSVDPDDCQVRVGGVDVTQAIRDPRVSAAVSAVAQVPEVRQHLVERFRAVIETSQRPGIITEGRDITTVVWPNAQTRILLTASEEARMARRSAELPSESTAVVANTLSSRDAQDSRVVDFTNAADGVTTLDSTDLDFDQTVQAVVALVRRATSKP